MRLPRSLGLVLTGFAGIVGIRTPPDPAVVAQTQPARPPTVPPPTGPPPAYDCLTQSLALTTPLS